MQNRCLNIRAKKKVKKSLLERLLHLICLLLKRAAHALAAMSCQTGDLELNLIANSQHEIAVTLLGNISEIIILLVDIRKTKIVTGIDHEVVKLV